MQVTHLLFHHLIQISSIFKKKFQLFIDRNLIVRLNTDTDSAVGIGYRVV